MKIVVTPECMSRLMAVSNMTQPDEWSGLGFSRNEGGNIVLYDFVPLDVGSFAYTEIPTPKLLELMKRPDYGNMKGWLHRHPMGSGTPGPFNWSGTDTNTIYTAPLGGLPELVGWSWSMVLTPSGWVGRIDNHLKKTCVHLEVEPSFADLYTEIHLIKANKRHAQAVNQEAWDANNQDLWDEEFVGDDMTPEEQAAELVDGLTKAEFADYNCTREELIDAILAVGELPDPDDFEPYQPTFWSMENRHGPHPTFGALRR
jgi:hypothetical protein